MREIPTMLFAAAVLSANATNEFFRQRDVRFFLELFTNWMSSWYPDGALSVHNTQIMRFLESLTHEGLTRRTYARGKRSAMPSYRVTRGGVAELCRIMRADIALDRPAQFFFLIYFIRSYREGITTMLVDGREYPPALLTEVQILLDEDTLIANVLESLSNEIRRLTNRIDDAKRAAFLTARAFAQGESVEEVARLVEQKHPYELNSMRRMSTLISSMPEELRRLELSDGITRRRELLWSTQRSILQSYHTLVEQCRRS